MNGGYTLVDESDYEELSKYKWRKDTHKACHAKKFYVVRYHRREAQNWTRISMHRQILSAPKGLMVDHINHDGLDNRRANLRLCSNAQNQHNARAQVGTSCKWRGVIYYKKNRKYLSSVICNKKRHYIGMSDCPDTLAMAWNEKARELFGEFAYQNVSSLNFNSIE
jgi:hypothetical protein